MADGRDGGGQTAAEKAFLEVCAVLATLRSEVEGLGAQLAQVLAASGKGGRTTDYSVTLGVMMKDLRALTDRVAAFEKSPLLMLNIGELGCELARAAEVARREDHQKLSSAASEMSAATTRLVTSWDSHLTAGEQELRSFKWGLRSALASFLLYLCLWGSLVRVTPDAWHTPEWMASRMLGKLGDDMYYEAGKRLIGAFSPKLWREQVLGARVIQGNPKTFAQCTRAAVTAVDGRASCTVIVNREMATAYLEQ